MEQLKGMVQSILNPNPEPFLHAAVCATSWHSPMQPLRVYPKNTNAPYRELLPQSPKRHSQGSTALCN
eukprot:1158387-Pelagomonas_calceolata.AAC.8